MTHIVRSNSLDFANNLKEIRKKEGYSQQELGELLGKTKKTIQNYEKGVTFPTLEILIRLSDLLEVKPSNLCSRLILEHPKSLLKKINDLECQAVIFYTRNATKNDLKKFKILLDCFMLCDELGEAFKFEIFLHQMTFKYAPNELKKKGIKMLTDFPNNFQHLDFDRLLTPEHKNDFYAVHNELFNLILEKNESGILSHYGHHLKVAEDGISQLFQ